MDVDWLASIAREEEKSVGAAFQDSRTHCTEFCQLFGSMRRESPSTSSRVESSGRLTCVLQPDGFRLVHWALLLRVCCGRSYPACARRSWDRRSRCACTCV